METIYSATCSVCGHNAHRIGKKWTDGEKHPHLVHTTDHNGLIESVVCHGPMINLMGRTREEWKEVKRNMNGFIIVTRHSGAVEWLRSRGVTGEVIPHATNEQVAGRRVVGVLPLHLAAAASEVWAYRSPKPRPGGQGA